MKGDNKRVSLFCKKENLQTAVMKSRKCVYIALLWLCPVVLWAQAPQGYYDAADQKKGAALKNAFYKIIQNHIQLEYYESATYFRTTDWNPAGYFWDMYSNNKRTSWSGLNREHSLPKSWWSTDPATTVAYSDLHNLYPSDATANSAKLNYPLGEVGSSVEYTNGVVKVGANSFGSTYKGSAFEPADEYKGDFARTYFYFITCYENYASSWRSYATSSVFLKNGEVYPAFEKWSLDLLLKWHRQDPVSQKEIDRNNKVFGFQQNRNPFVDYPDLAEYIWGTKVDSVFTVEDKLDDPTLITPTNDITVNFSEVLVNTQTTKSIPIKGKGLTGNVSVILYDNLSGYFSIATQSISASLINRTEGYELPIKYYPKETGNHSASLILYDGGINGSVSVKISGESVTTLSIDDEYVDNADATNVYLRDGSLHFKDVDFGQKVFVYSISGQLIFMTTYEGENIPFDGKGIHIVRIGERGYKIIQ